jgi:hypothetical protein
VFSYQQGGPTEITAANATVTLNRTKTGEYLPKWRSIIRNGQNATTPFNGVKQEVSTTRGHMIVYIFTPVGSPRHMQSLQRYMFDGTEYAAPLVPTSTTSGDVALADNRALGQLYARIRQQNSHFSGGVFLGELRETIRMIRRPAMTLRNGLRDYFSALSKRKRGAPRHRLKSILADTWLEYSFGWKPLVNDTIAAAEALARFENDERRSSISSKGISEILLDSGTMKKSGQYGYLHVIQHYTRVASTKIFYRVGMEYTANAPFGSAKRLAELSGFKPEEFIPTAWELIPWSFVVDYFSNVGDIISARCTDTTSVTRKTRTNVSATTVYNSHAANLAEYNLTPGAKDVYSLEGDGFGSFIASRSTVARASIDGLGIPVLTFSLPALSSTKWINLAALTANSRALTPFFGRKGRG